MSGDNDQLAKELRELAAAIDKLCRDSPCTSLAGPIVRNCCDHLRARAVIVARNSDLSKVDRNDLEELVRQELDGR